ncbi:uncharacterized protein BDFB_002956, partial [Asbolus verrucosus]
MPKPFHKGRKRLLLCCKILRRKDNGELLCPVTAVQEHITRTLLLELLKGRQIFNGCVNSLGKVLKEIGFRYKKDEPRRGLIELQHVVFVRVHFLRKYMDNCDQIYHYNVDETWIFENGTVSRSWQDDSHK